MHPGNKVLEFYNSETFESKIWTGQTSKVSFLFFGVCDVERLIESANTMIPKLLKFAEKAQSYKRYPKNLQLQVFPPPKLQHL